MMYCLLLVGLLGLAAATDSGKVEPDTVKVEHKAVPGVEHKFAFASSDGFSDTTTRKHNCKIEGDQVTSGGKTRTLTAEEKKSLADYTIALDEYFKKAFHPKALATERTAMPKFPEICKAADEIVSEHHITAFDGCSITDDQLYIDGKFIRALTDEEKKQLVDFRAGIEKFKSTIDDFIRGQMASALGGKGALTTGGGSKQPQPPTPPKICPLTKPEKAKAAPRKVNEEEHLDVSDVEV